MLIALVYTLSIIVAWYSVKYDLWKTIFIVGLVVALMLSAGGIMHLLRRRGILTSNVYIDLTTDEHQWAPTAGASMIVGWSAAATNFIHEEAVILLLVGLLYSFWCVLVLADAAHPEFAGVSSERKTSWSRKKLILALTFTHVFVSGLFGYSASLIFRHISYIYSCLLVPLP